MPIRRTRALVGLDAETEALGQAWGRAVAADADLVMIIGEAGIGKTAPAGEAAIRQVATEAGFTRFRRAAETPFNLVYEVRP
jgi:predicted ribonuclease YlaK